MDNVFVVAYPKIDVMCHPAISEPCKYVDYLLTVASCTFCVNSQVTSLCFTHCSICYLKIYL